MKNSRGQALVLVLLSLAVVLTLALYIVSRTVTDIAVSSREEEALRAFSAAEAGVERALVIGSSIGNTTIGDANFSANVSGFAEGTYSFSYPANLSSGDAVTLWFVDHDEDGNLSCGIGDNCFSGNILRVCWGKPGTSSSSDTAPAIELSVLYSTTPMNYSTLRIGRGAFDPNDNRLTENAFSSQDSTSCQIGGETFAFGQTIDLSAELGVPALSDGGLQYAKVRMLYNTTENHKVGFDVDFSGNDPLPSQGLMIDSSGTSGDSNRRLEVFQAWPEAPSVFDYALFSSSGIVK